MAKFRMIDTKFRSDNYIADLDPIEKLLFIYFFTNPYTNISGIYELSLKQIALDTWIDRQEMLPKIIKRFSDWGKIYYIDWWVYVKNFQKHQKTESKKIQKWIENWMGLIPTYILEKVKGIDTLYIPYTYPSININSNFNFNSNSSKEETGIKIPDNTNKDFLKKEITLKINFLIKELQETASQYKIAYNTTKEREFWKHIVNAKQYGAFCESIWQDRVEFAKNVMTASIDGYWKWICAWPMAIYQNYADVYNKHIQKQTKQIPFIPWI